MSVNTAVDLIDSTVAQIRELRTEEVFDSMENTARSMARESHAATEFRSLGAEDSREKKAF